MRGASGFGQLGLLASLCAMGAWSASVWAHAPMTLGAMIDLENKAIAQAQAKHRKAASKPAVIAKLLSIYGVGATLYAVVQVNEQTVTFVQGQARPLNTPANNMRLRVIKPPCVRFSRGAAHYTVCLPKGRP